MMFSAKAVFTERRTGIASVVAWATGQGMVLMGLRTSPGWNGHLVDEILLATPGGWNAELLESFLLASGAATVSVSVTDAEGRPVTEEAERRARTAHPAGAGRASLARAS